MDRENSLTKQKMHINTGGGFVILLISVLALTVFAVLSIRASYNELRMAERMRNSVEAYYEADQRAGERCAEIFRAWEMTQPGDRVEQEHSFELEVDYNRILKVRIHSDKENCAITEWKLESSEYGSYEGESIEIWNGSIE